MQTSRRSFLALSTAALALAAMPALASAPKRMGVEIMDYDGTAMGEDYKWKRITGLDAVKRGQLFRFLEDNGEPCGTWVGKDAMYYGIAEEDGQLVRSTDPDSPNFGHMEGYAEVTWYELFDRAIADWRWRNIRVFSIGEDTEIYGAYSEAEARAHYLSESFEGEEDIAAHFHEITELDTEFGFLEEDENCEPHPIRTTWRKVAEDHVLPCQLSSGY